MHSDRVPGSKASDFHSKCNIFVADVRHKGMTVKKTSGDNIMSKFIMRIAVLLCALSTNLNTKSYHFLY